MKRVFILAAALGLALSAAACNATKNAQKASDIVDTKQGGEGGGAADNNGN